VFRSQISSSELDAAKAQEEHSDRTEIQAHKFSD